MPAGRAPGSGSGTLDWTTRVNGRSLCRPASTAASLAATSASVPPRCTVPATRHSGAVHGTGPDSA